MLNSELENCKLDVEPAKFKLPKTLKYLKLPSNENITDKGLK